MSRTRFYVCKKCGNIVGLIHGAGVPLVCCGEVMEHLNPKINDSGNEKHIPVVTVSGDRVSVSVGSQLHPMENEHGVRWIYLQTDRGGQRKCLEESGAPVAEFALCDEKPEAVYAYCNLHGLWMTAL